MGTYAARGNSRKVLKWLIPVRWGRFFERGTGAVLDLHSRAGYRAIEMFLYTSALHLHSRAAAQTKFVRSFSRCIAALAPVGGPGPHDYSFLSYLLAVSSPFRGGRLKSYTGPAHLFTAVSSL